MCKKHLRVENTGMDRNLKALGIGTTPVYTAEQEEWFANYAWREVCRGDNALLRVLEEEAEEIQRAGLPLDGVPRADDVEGGYLVQCSECSACVAHAFATCAKGCGVDVCVRCARRLAGAGSDGGRLACPGCPGEGGGGRAACDGALAVVRLPQQPPALVSAQLAHARNPEGVGTWRGGEAPRKPLSERELSHLPPKIKLKLLLGRTSGGPGGEEPAARPPRVEDNLDQYRRTGHGYLFCPTKADLQGAANTSRASFGAFQGHWRAGEPVVIRNVRGLMSWTPDLMTRATRSSTSGNEMIDVVDCAEAGGTAAISIHQFFKAYKGLLSPPLMLKLKDWPREGEFRDKLKRLYYDVVDMLPLPEYTHPGGGPLNLATMFPARWDKAANPAGWLWPEVGPKSYLACGRPGEAEPHGPFLQRDGDSVVKLHLDVADTITIMVHCQALKEDEIEAAGRVYFGRTGPAAACPPAFDGAGAVWDVFARADVPKLRRFLHRHRSRFQHGVQGGPGGEPASVERVEDPVTDQTFYLSRPALELLKAEEGVEPWTVEQYKDEAVLVPAGCPFQVRNLKSCIKVAVDFISPESVGEVLRLQEELSDYHLQARAALLGCGWRALQVLGAAGGDAEAPAPAPALAAAAGMEEGGDHPGS